MQSKIAEIAAKYKGELHTWVVPAALVLVGLSAFGLGRLSVMGSEGPRLLIRLPDGTTQTAAAYQAAQAAPAAAKAPASQAGEYVASKNGTKYYLISCAAAGRINEENKIYFDSLAEAQAAGYTPAANCPGL